MAGWFGAQLLLWLLGLTLEAIKALWGLLANTAFSTPDVTTLPQVQAITSKSLIVVNVGFILAIITAGITVMTHETVQIRYGVGELAPRLVVGWIAANFSMPICSHLTELANALTQALTGEGVASPGAFGQLLRVVVDAMTNPASTFLSLVIGLIIAVLTGMLLVAWLVRLGVLIVLVGIAPVALACHALPYTDGAARLWWRSFLAVLGTVILQAVALHTALRIFLDPNANVPSLGLPKDPTGVLNLFIVACLLWVVVKIPGLMRRYVTRGGGQHNVAGLIVRMVLVQQLAGLLRLPFRGRGGAGRGPHCHWRAAIGGQHGHRVLASPDAAAHPGHHPHHTDAHARRGRRAAVAGAPVRPRRGQPRHRGAENQIRVANRPHRCTGQRSAARAGGAAHSARDDTGHRDAAHAAGLAGTTGRPADRAAAPAAGAAGRQPGQRDAPPTPDLAALTRPRPCRTWSSRPPQPQRTGTTCPSRTGVHYG